MARKKTHNFLFDKTITAIMKNRRGKRNAWIKPILIVPAIINHKAINAFGVSKITGPAGTQKRLDFFKYLIVERRIRFHKILTIPLSASTSTLSPSLITFVASLVPTMQGVRNSRETIAA